MGGGTYGVSFPGTTSTLKNVDIAALHQTACALSRPSGKPPVRVRFAYRAADLHDDSWS